MKGISKKLLALMVLTIPCTLIHAEGSTPYSPCEHRAAVTTTRLLLKPQSNRPRIPSKEYILCHYDGSIIWFQMPEGTDLLEVTILNEETSSSCEYDITHDSSIYIGTGAYGLFIQCRTSNNQVYEGKLKSEKEQQ